MPGGYRDDPINALIAEVQRLRADVNALQQSQFYLPIVDEDPAVNQVQGNCWVFADGRLRVRLYDGTIKEWVATSTPGGAISGTPKPARPAAGTGHLSTWTATWSQSYQNDGTQRSDYPERLWIGNFPGALGNNAALIGFDYADIQATLAGAIITGVKTFYSNASSNGADNRIHVYWGTHFNTTAPTLWGNLFTYPVYDQWYGSTEANWVTLPKWVGEELRDGQSTGLLVAGGDGAGVNGWGWGVGTTQPPQLEITYVK